LVFGTEYVRDIHVVGGGTEIFVFPLGEDLPLVSHCHLKENYINSDQMDFSVTVLSSFGCTHVDDL
jgi:hypothetical protein